MSNHDDADARRIKEMLERHDTGSWNTDELAKRIYELDKENLRTTSELDKRISLIEDFLKKLPGIFANLVTMDRFRTVELIVFGMVGGVCLTFLGAILQRVLR